MRYSRRGSAHKEAMRDRENHSSPWVWMSAGFLSLTLLAVLGVMLLIGWKGLSFFWPSPVYQFEITTPQGIETFFGEIYDVSIVSSQQLTEAGVTPEALLKKQQKRWLIHIANRDREAHDFISVLEQNIVSMRANLDIAVIERRGNGDFFGIPVGYISAQDADFSPHYHSQQHRLWVKPPENIGDSLIVDDRNRQAVVIPVNEVLGLWYPNAMSISEKWRHWGQQIVRFVSEDPRAANSAGGVFPAIFGTVLMVLLMAVIVTPLGVLAAIYLHEYASKNVFTRLLRITVVNLAGVPSIVYGVFGLGFFVYFLGGNIDTFFYADTLPSPTFGTPGIFWSSLTLAILTLPVVIVSTEEGLARIPMSVRHGSMALGATQAETLWRIVLPMASPAIITGLILAIARAAGEVAPLMLLGVVKVAPSLALDGQFPYLHLDRQFMHLGYHIYDVAFQSPNIEAARPLVYAISLLLLVVIVCLNITAILIRHRLREKYRVLEPEI